MADSTEVTPGTVLLDRYELVEIIGHGGFGTVWRARQLLMDRDVAVKILPPEFVTVRDIVARFEREAKLASRLRHPNTITLHDYGKQDNLLFIVMELLVGEDLADLLKREGRLPPDRIMSIASQVLKSLAEAHDQHIVHRDLKPENIFLSVVGDDRDHVKVLDFGIAKLAQPTGEEDQDARRLTLSGSTVGTPTYMSPEQAAGEEVDGTTDLYALGILMYEMACGRPPFHDKDPVKVMRAQLFEPVPPMRDRSLQGTVLDRVVQKALAKDRDQRFQSANQMLLALAGEAVARPKIQGISFSQLGEETSTDDVSLAQFLEPNTGDFTPEAEEDRNETLAFVKSRDRDEAPSEDDSVPFTEVPPKESVRTPLASPGSSSSIVSLSGEPDDAEVILLTKPKEAAPRTPVAVPSPPAEEVEQDVPQTAPEDDVADAVEATDAADAANPSDVPPPMRLKKQAVSPWVWIVGIVVAVAIAYLATR